MNVSRLIKATAGISLVLAASLMASPTKAELDAHKKIVGYYPEWGAYAGHNNYAPADIPFEKLTHVNYAFAKITNGEIGVFDEWAATGIAFGESFGSEFAGTLGQFKKLKASHPNTSFLISVGGWSLSAAFHDVAATSAARKKFADSCVRYIRKWRFDGVDIDWEFPGHARQADKIDNANDTGTPQADDSEIVTFTLLLKDIRDALTKAGEEDGRYYQLTAAIGAGADKILKTEPDKYMQYLDFVNMMTYDMHGAWNETTNHQSALYQNPALPDDGYTVDSAVKFFESYGIDSNKILIGSPFYTRGWKGVLNDGPIVELPGLGATADGGADGTWDGGQAAGVNPYYYVTSVLENDASFKKYRDPISKMPYIYSESKGEMYTYEDETSLHERINYVKENDLGGVIYWEITSDSPSKGTSLLSVISNDLFNDSLPTYANDNLPDYENDPKYMASWEEGKDYPAGSKVKYDGKVYESSYWTNGKPGEDAAWVIVDAYTVEPTDPIAPVESVTPVVPVDPVTPVEPITPVNPVDPIVPPTPVSKGNWDASQIYTSGMKVTYNGKSYEAKWWSKGDTPGAQQWGPWKVLGEAVVVSVTPVNPVDPITPVVPENSGTWKDSQTYTLGMEVTYNGKSYEAKWWTRGDIPGTQQWGPWKVLGTATTNPTNPVTPVDPIEPVVPVVPVVPTEPTPDTGFSMTQEELDEKEYALTSTPLMTSVKDTIRTIDSAEVEKIVPNRFDNPVNTRRVEGIISSSDWDFMFPKRSPEYTYTNFLKAVGKFPAFCGEYDDGRDAEQICRKSLATMFAHFTQETGGHTSHWEVPEWRQALVHVREMGWNENMRGGYNSECNPDIWQGQTWPCGTFDDGEYKSYFGRGAKQLSYNYNYGPFSEAVTGDVRTLMDNPELVADTWLNLASAVFFYVYPQPPKPSMLHVVDGTWQPNDRDISNGLLKGFGVTTQVINGGVECGGSVEVAQSLNRISYYKEFANYLNVPIEEQEVLGCKGMKQFDADGAGALNIYWEQDWGYDATKPEGKTYACKLVGYQTPFSAFKEGDYSNCVAKYFDLVIK